MREREKERKREREKEREDRRESEREMNKCPVCVSEGYLSGVSDSGMRV